MEFDLRAYLKPKVPFDEFIHVFGHSSSLSLPPVAYNCALAMCLIRYFNFPIRNSVFIK